MREAMLMVHLLGLVMGLGTSFAFLFLGRAGSKLEKEEGKKFALNALPLGTMGHIGITMLIISGLYLMTPFWMTLHARPFLIAKLILVMVLTVCIILLGIYSRRARKGDSESYLGKIAILGKVSLFTGVCIMLLAVLTFH